jgi:hypothetical protein
MAQMYNQAKFGPGGCGRQGEITSRPACAEHSLLLIRVLGHGMTEAQTNGENGVECGRRNAMVVIKHAKGRHR